MARYLPASLAVALVAAALLVAPVATGVDSPLTLTPPAGRVVEGSPAEVTARFDAAGAAGPDRFSFAWGEGQISVVPAPADSPYTATAAHAYADEGTYPVRVQVTVPGTSPVSRGTQVTVVNAAPVLGPLPDTLAPLRQPFRLSVSFADPGSADTQEVVVDWGDGAADRLEDITGGIASFTHRYTARKAYVATVSVDDRDGGRDTATFRVEVVLACGGLPVTIDAASAPPGPVVGTAGNDVILGTRGPDDISGGGGRDTICGGGGADTLDGGPGDDTLLGGPGADELLGGPGRDSLSGGESDDDLAGGDGPDAITGDAGNDTLDGGAGTDALAGGAGSDVLQGGPDGDVLHGGTGVDRLYGGDGGDFLFRSEWPSLDQMDGGPGENIVEVGKRGTEATGIRRYLTEAEALAFQGAYLLGEFTTYHDCCQDRVANIQLMADTIAGHVVMPGEAFSVNATVGQRTAAKGYRPAGAIIGGYVQCCDYADNMGGGTSQFGTTIYNAVFFAGLEDIEHQPHSLDFARYPDGREATMGWPHPDVVFRNDTAHPVLITTHHAGFRGTSITVRIWGDSDGRQVTAGASARRDIYNTSRVVYEADPSLSPGQSYVKTAAQAGYTIDVFRYIAYRDGSRTTEKWTWTYSAGPEVRRVHPCKVPAGNPDYTGEACPGGGDGDGNGDGDGGWGDGGLMP